MSSMEELLDRRDFAETADSILYARPRLTTIFFPLFALTFFIAVGWSAFIPFEETTHARGDLRVAGDALPVHAQQEGRVISIATHEGAFVEKGAVLFALDDPNGRLELARTAAEIKRARQTIALLEAQRVRARSRSAVEIDRIAREIARNREMYERGILSQQVVENLESDRRARVEASRQEELAIEAETVAARQSFDRLENEFTRRRRALGEQTIRAAESGVITQLRVRNAGELVPRGSVMAKITPRGRDMEFEAVVPPHEIARVRPGLQSRIELDAYPRRRFGAIDGRVTFVAPDRDQRGYRIRVAIDPSKLELRSGMPGTVAVIGDRRPLYRVIGERLGVIR